MPSLRSGDRVRRLHNATSMSGFPALHDATLHERGLTGSSLIDAAGRICLPYDAVREPELPRGLRPLAEIRTTLCAREHAFRLPDGDEPVHLLNGMGVALGDAIVGLSVLAALQAQAPRRPVVLHPARHAPASVQQLLGLAAACEVQPLPLLASDIPDDAALIDLGDFAYWPHFGHFAMHDFFASALGVDDLQEATRRNAWLSSLELPPLPAEWRQEPFVLFAPLSSSPLRTLSPGLQFALVELASTHYGLPVLGFTEIAHPGYHCVAEHSRDTSQFLSWIRAARVLVSTDSAAVHAAAGFSVPTLAGFTCIAPALRVAGYPRCTALDLRRPELDGLHFSEEPALVSLAEDAWRQAIAAGLPWPAIPDRGD